MSWRTGLPPSLFGVSFLSIIFIFCFAQDCASISEVKLDGKNWEQLKTGTNVRVYSSSQPFLLAYDGRSWRNRWQRYSQLMVPDPLEEIKEHVIRKLSEKLPVVDLPSFQKGHNPSTGHLLPWWLDYMPDPAPDLEKLKEEFKTGVVLQFETLEWKLYLPRILPWSFHPLRLWYRARATLIEVEESKISWPAVCDVERKSNEQEPEVSLSQWLFADRSASTLLKEWTGYNNALLKAKREEIVKACANQLITKFF